MMTFHEQEVGPHSLLSAWNFTPNLADTHCIFPAPEGAQQISFLPAEHLVPPDTQ